MSVHQFTINSDGTFPNKKVDVPRFTQEISTDPNITSALDTVDVVAGNCVVTFKADISLDELLALEALVFAHSGEPLLDSSRQSVVIQPFATTGRNVALSGHRQVCTVNAVTDLDITWDEEREIQGAEIQVKDFTDGDFVEAELRHPAVGMLVDFGKSYIKPDGCVSLEAESAKPVPAGLVIRIRYTSTAVDGPAPVMFADVKTWR